ncbi:MAG: acyloxyacyl hydrolase [Kiloniellales bacterium]
MRAGVQGVLLAAALGGAWSAITDPAAAAERYATPYGYYLEPGVGAVAGPAVSRSAYPAPPAPPAPPPLPPSLPPLEVATPTPESGPVVGPYRRDIAATDGSRDDAPGLETEELPWGGWLSEFRLGLLAHNIGPIASAREEGVQLNGEFRFASPSLFAYILSPRPHVGVSVNTAGDTSFLYSGLTWTWDITDGLFLDLSFGGTVHNGWLGTHEPDPDRRLLGSRLLFRESAELGYRFLDHHSLSLMLDHVSNAGLVDRNQGNDDIGLRYGYRF